MPSRGLGILEYDQGTKKTMMQALFFRRYCALCLIQIRITAKVKSLSKALREVIVGISKTQKAWSLS